MVLMTRGEVYKTISLSLRQQRQPTTSQRHRRSCSSGTGFGWTSIRGQTLRVWRRRSNNTQRTTPETARTRTFQRDTWVDNVTDTSLLKDSGCMYDTVCVVKLETEENNKVLVWTGENVNQPVASKGHVYKYQCWINAGIDPEVDFVLLRFVFQMDLMPFVSKAGCECLNESDDCGFDNCLIKDSTYMESDCDEQVRAGNSNNPPLAQMCDFAITRMKDSSVSLFIIWRAVNRFQIFNRY